MTVLETIETDMRSAMKGRDAFRLGVLRLVKTAVKNKEIELIRPLADAEFIAVLNTLIKQRKEAAEHYAKAGRAEAAASETNEITVISKYLPQQLDEAEISRLIASAISKTGAAGPQDMGKVMKELRDDAAGRVDGKVLADKVRAALQK